MSERLRVAKLRIVRGGRRVVDELTFTLDAGRALLVTGPNGAGKTSLLRAIAGFLPAAAGCITLEQSEADGVEFGDDARAEKCHFLGIDDAVKTPLTVAENVSFWSAFLGRSTAKDCEEAVEYMGLGPLSDVPAAYLSAGQRRRLGLARLLVAKRPLWLLDEPTIALDVDAVDLLMTMVARHMSEGGLAIIATHVPVPLANSSELTLQSGSALPAPEAAQ